MFFRLSIDETDEGDAYLINATVMACFESSGPCILDVPLFNNALLPKPQCLLGKGFKIPGMLTAKSRCSLINLIIIAVIVLQH